MLCGVEGDNFRGVLCGFFLGWSCGFLGGFFIFSYSAGETSLEEGKDNIKLINYFLRQFFL